MNIFDTNELLKERLITDYNASEAKTVYFKEGVEIMPEPFLETVVVWRDKIKKNFIIKSIQEILLFKNQVKNRCFVTDIQYEIINNQYQLIWAIFKEKEDFFEKT